MNMIDFVILLAQDNGPILPIDNNNGNNHLNLSLDQQARGQIIKNASIWFKVVIDLKIFILQLCGPTLAQSVVTILVGQADLHLALDHILDIHDFLFTIHSASLLDTF
jgi:hypothetical protein